MEILQIREIVETGVLTSILHCDAFDIVLSQK